MTILEMEVMEVEVKVLVRGVKKVEMERE